MRMPQLLDPLVLTILSRAIERCLIVVAAVACLCWGYRLFMTVTSNVSNAYAEGLGYKIRLDGIGPGIFFAIIGAGILINSIINSVSIENTPTEDRKSVITSIHTTTYRGGQEDVRGEFPDHFKAINTLVDIGNRRKSWQEFSDMDKLLIDKSIIHLKIVQGILVDQIAGSGAYNAYHAMEKDCRSNARACQDLKNNLDRNNIYESIRDMINNKIDN